MATTATPSVVDMGVIKASQAASGLGFGISQLGYTQDWEFATAKAAGASWVRIQCPWSAVEQQTAPPNNRASTPQYIQTPGCVSALTSAANHGLHVTEVAAFGPPYHQILYVTLPNGAPSGATSLNVQLQAGIGGDTLSSIIPNSDYWCPALIGDNGVSPAPYICSYVPTARSSTQGALIDSVTVTDATHATIGLASALTTALPANPATMTGCSITTISGTLTCTGGGFTPAMVGNTQVVIPGAGGGGSNFTVGIQTYLSPTQVTLPCCAPTAVSNVTVQANVLYAIGELLYPSAASQSPSDPSVVAYSNYVNFLASDMAARGVSGEIEIWNEPPWAGDPWDFRPYLYDYANSGPYSSSSTYNLNSVVTENNTLYISLANSNTGHDPASSPSYWSNAIPSNVYPAVPTNGADFGFAANLQARMFPPGVTAVWNGTSGSGYESLLTSNMATLTGVPLNQPSTLITRESFHPYGGAYGFPEDMMGVPSCLQSAAAAGAQGSPYNCYLPGSPQTANMFYAVYLDDQAKLVNAANGIGHSITETNTLGTAAGQRVQQARFDLRHFLGFQAMGVTPIEFFQLWDDTHSDPSFSFVDYQNSTVTRLANYTAMAGLMADLNTINNAPVGSYAESSLAAVTSYSGAYPLSTLHIVGTKAGASANSDAFVMWQLSSCLTASNCWISMPSPAASPVTVSIPSGMQVSAVTNLTTRAAVSYTSSGQQIAFNVSDDPVEVMVQPQSSTPQTPATSATSQALTFLTAQGDSNTHGMYVASPLNAYPAQLAAMLQLPFLNNGVNGATSASLESALYSTPSSSLETYMIGTNNVTAGGSSSSYIATFGLNVLSQYAWMAIPPGAKTIATNTAAIKYSGPWSAGTFSLGQKTSTVGSSATFTVTGSSVLISTTMIPSNTGSASLNCDGVATGVSPVVTGSGGSTFGGLPASGLVAVTGLANTTHTCTVSLTAAGTLDLNWVAGVGTANATYPNFYALGIMDRNPVDTSTPSYRTQEINAVAALNSYGLTNAHYVSTAGLVPSNFFVDSLHTDDYGYFLVATAIMNAIDADQQLSLAVPAFRGNQLTNPALGPYSYGIGYQALGAASGGGVTNTEALGPFAFGSATSTMNGSALGFMACYQDVSGNGNTCVGDQSGPTTDGYNFTVNLGLLAKTSATGAVQIGNGTNPAANTMQFQSWNFLNSSGDSSVRSVNIKGTTFTATGCSNSNLVGGATAGSFKAGLSGACTVTIATGVTASHGWVCNANDLTTLTDTVRQIASTTTTATLSGLTVAGDVVNFACLAY